MDVVTRALLFAVFIGAALLWQRGMSAVGNGLDRLMNRKEHQGKLPLRRRVDLDVPGGRQDEIARAISLELAVYEESAGLGPRVYVRHAGGGLQVRVGNRLFRMPGTAADKGATQARGRWSSSKNHQTGEWNMLRRIILGMGVLLLPAALAGCSASGNLTCEEYSELDYSEREDALEDLLRENDLETLDVGNAIGVKENVDSFCGIGISLPSDVAPATKNLSRPLQESTDWESSTW